MLSELQQRNVWEGWLSAEIRTNYFAELVGNYRMRQRLITWLTLLFSSGAVVVVIGTLPDTIAWTKPVFPLIAAALSLYSLVAQNEKNAIESSDLHFGWNRLASRYEALWDDMYAEDAAEKLASLQERGAELSKSGTTFPNRERMMLKWQAYVHQHHGMPMSRA